MKKILATYIGKTNYKEIWDLQKKIWSLRKESLIDDVLILNQHNHVYTIGKNGNQNHLLANEAELQSRGAELFYIDRGGDITYHGPGQLVGYPIINLQNYYLDVHRYLRDIEETIILTLRDFGIEAKHIDGLTGVWVKNDKIAAIGIKVSRWITMHGFALNVHTDLSYFDHIIPCGIFNKGVTSIREILQRELDISEIVNSYYKNFERIFNCKLEIMSNQDFFNFIGEKINEENKCLQLQ